MYALTSVASEELHGLLNARVPRTGGVVGHSLAHLRTAVSMYCHIGRHSVGGASSRRAWLIYSIKFQCIGATIMKGGRMGSKKTSINELMQVFDIGGDRLICYSANFVVVHLHALAADDIPQEGYDVLVV